MTANSKYIEQRSGNRVSIPDQPTILDAHNGEAIGQLVNLSTDGLMVAGTQAIDRSHICQMRIPLVKDDKQLEIQVGAESLWSEDANDSGTYWTGFHIIDISPEDREILNAIVGD